MWHKNFHKEIKTQRKRETWVFFKGSLMKNGELWRSMVGQKQYGYKPGGLSKTCSFRFFCAPMFLEIRILLASGYQEGSSHMGVFWCISEKGQKKFYYLLQGRKVVGKITVTSCCFLKCIQSICQGSIFWGSMFRPQHLLSILTL
jgi:hypothetical protein